uniref:C-type lectin domain-containing protein n=1 Tax=Amphiprion percula TaxID=161767 RepID=A0A3P8UDK5_AMPPE
KAFLALIFALLLIFCSSDLHHLYEVAPESIQTPSLFAHFVGWYGAQEYCISEYTTLAHIKHQDNITALMNAPKRPYTGKAWIGLYGFTMVSSKQWLLINEQKATYFNWSSGEPDNYGGKELCVSMTSNGDWQDQNCSAKKASLCYNGEKLWQNKGKCSG